MLRLKKKWGRQEGFTLIELLVVVAILGVLVGIAAPRVVQSLQGARTNRDKSNTRIVQTAIERYAFDNNGAYPLLRWNTSLNPAAWDAVGTVPSGSTLYRIDFYKLVGTYLTDYPDIPDGTNQRFVVDDKGRVTIGTPTDWTAGSGADSDGSGPDTALASDRP